MGKYCQKSSNYINSAFTASSVYGTYRTIPYPKTRVMSNVFTPQYELSGAVIYSNFSIKVLRARPALCMVLEFVKISILGELTSL